MAPLNFSISLIRFVFYYSLFLLFLFSYFSEKTKAIGSQFHNFEVTSILAASTCNRHSSAGSNLSPTTLEVFHRLGPCSPHYEHTKNKSSLANILSHDQSRVDSIQARHKQNLLRNNKVSLPAPSALPLNNAGYVVTIGLGTPPQNVTLMFDTGSDLTWTQCMPCIECYEQRYPVYEPFFSRTYSRISCGSRCSKFTYYAPCYRGSCAYNKEYMDGSYSQGVVSKERLTISSTTHDVFEDFLFGCGQKNKGHFGETSGLLGLGRTPYEMSFLYQTAHKYKRYFSYCLPSTESLTGHLTFGTKRSNNHNLKFTPLIPDPEYYRIEIVAISVGGTRLSINQSVFQNPGTIIDSGTVFTRLPQEAYVKMRNAFNQMMGSLYPTAPAFGIFDTCYNINNQANIMVPVISFTFRGNVEVRLSPYGTMSIKDSMTACLAFAGNTDPNQLSVFGNAQQKTFEVVYDVESEKLGFGPGGCH